MKNNTVVFLEDDSDESEFVSQKSQSRADTKKGSFKRKSSWITPSFDDFDMMPGSSNKCSSRKGSKKGVSKGSDSGDNLRTESLSKEDAEQNVPWVEKYKPRVEAELAVHKKKVSEIRDWLCQSLSQRRGGVLLLTGPAGCGKTAALDCLCSELGVQIQEWVNPEVQTQSEFAANKHFELMWSESQTKQFQDFLFRANRYSGIVGVTSSTDINSSVKRVICIEEMPTFIFRDVSKFQEMIRQYKKTSRNPLVFIISDNFTGNSNVHSLFPRHLQAELKIRKISLNPVSTTNLIKTMSSIAAKECRRDPQNLKNPTKHDLDLLASSSNGDIRSAVNALQFSCTKGQTMDFLKRQSTTPLSTNQIASKARKQKNSKASAEETRTSSNQEGDNPMLTIGSRDSSLFLFRALGKILYCKREAGTKKEECKQLPNNLQEYARDRLLINPDDVVEKTRISGETINLYLHHNFLDFYNDIDDVANADGYFSDADHMAGSWTSREVLAPYTTLLGPRAVTFFSHCKTTTGSGSHSWKPLHKPQWFDVNKEIQSHHEAVKHLFRSFREPSQELQTEVLPFLAKINAPLESPSQISLLQTITHFQLGRQNNRHFVEQLADSEVGVPDLNSADLLRESHIRRAESSCSLASTLNNQLEESDEELIDDFED